jgi:hypothetical protein
LAPSCRESRQRPDRAGNIGLAVIGAEAEFLEKRPEPGGRSADLAEKLTKRLALSHDLGKQRIEPGLAAARKNRGEGFGQFRTRASDRPGDHVAPRRSHQRLFHLRVQHLEMGDDVRLQRELVQHRLAEGVDGLDFQPARRFQRLGEQAACALQGLGIGPPPVHRLDAPGKLGLVQRRPFRQRGKDAVRHVGGRRARIGQAQDFRRFRAAQQQPDDALGQHMRLARAGVCRHPCRIGGVGGACLRQRSIGRDRIFHSSPPSPAPSPPADHSSTRARWS